MLKDNSIYLSSSSLYTFLTSEEERERGRHNLETKGLEEMDNLIRHNIKLVVSVVKDLYTKHERRDSYDIE